MVGSVFPRFLKPAARPLSSNQGEKIERRELEPCLLLPLHLNTWRLPRPDKTKALALNVFRGPWIQIGLVIEVVTPTLSRENNKIKLLFCQSHARIPCMYTTSLDTESCGPFHGRMRGVHTFRP